MKTKSYSTRILLLISLVLLAGVLSLVIVSSAIASPDSDSTSPAPAAAVPYDNPVEIPVARLEELVTGLVYPSEIKSAGDGSGRLFILQQTGEVLIYDGSSMLPTPFLDISADVECCGEKGLRSIAFHPDYSSNGFFYILYSHATGVPKQPETRLVKFTVSAADPDVADPTSAQILLQLPQPYGNHNGGQLQFGSDGYLYISLGDGGSAGDPDDQGQDLSTWFGSLLRIDVDGGSPYAIPAGNPFLEDPDDPDTLPEIWHYGFRNHWRFSFDSANDDLYIADVGQDDYEEINILPGGTAGGLNFGWRCYEGDTSYNLTGCGPIGDYTFPEITYMHDTLPCYSVTGGYVYRGSAIDALIGKYIFADYCSGHIWATHNPTGSAWETELLLDSNLRITSFGVDDDGEMYLVRYNETYGKLFKVVPDETDKVGFYVPDTRRWFMKNDHQKGWNDDIFFQWGGISDAQAISGDWDDNGVDTAGFYAPSQGKWYLKFSHSDGWTDFIKFKFAGPADAIAVAGDWDNDGVDTPGFYIPSQGKWYFKDSQTKGWGDVAMVRFAGGSGFTPLVGDWNNDGFDTPGFYDPATEKWYLKNDLVDGWTNFVSLKLGKSDTILPVAGDWDNDGFDTPGLYRPSTGTWFLKNDLVSGWTNYVKLRFSAPAGSQAVAGDWH